jgi:hypothetical protein
MKMIIECGSRRESALICLLGRCMRFAAVCLGLLLALPAHADTWTNAAGHVITAKLVAIEGGQVLLQNTNGRTWRLPLTSLKPADRQRAREQAGTEPLPNDLKIPFEQAQEDIHRAAQFLHGGKITREEYATRCETLRQRFEHLGQQALKERGEPADTVILDRLKQRLDQSTRSAGTIVPPPR